MKKPRFEDFPTIKNPPKPVKELHSPLDDLPSIIPPQERDNRVIAEPPLIQIEHPSERPYVRTPARRTITRYAFEFFADQLDELKQISLQEKMLGKKGSMSEMVRKAIDVYLQKRREAEK